MMRLVPKWSFSQWLGSAFMLVGAVGFGWSLQPKSEAVSPVAIANLGLAVDHAERSQVVAASMPKFMLVGAAAAEDNSHKVVKLWDAMLQVRGSHFPNTPQEVGDCVSWGCANAINYLQAVQLIRGPPGEEEFHPAFPPWIYGSSRILVGKKHGSRFTGDGSVGAYAAEAVNTYGCLRSDFENVPPYSGAVARDWGAKGPPQWAIAAAKAFLVQSIAQMNTAEDARDAICNGYPVTIASSWWGTDKIPVVDGRRVATRTMPWGHQQCLIAYDGSVSPPLFYCLNSWGPNAHPAPMMNEPPGGYWIRMSDVDRICKEGDSWALSSFDGFPADGKVDWDALSRRPAVVGYVNPGQGGNGTMFSVQAVALASCGLMVLGGFVLFVISALKRRRGRTVIAMAFVTGLCANGFDSHAQDSASDPMPQAFQAAATRNPVQQTTVGEHDQAFAEASCRPVEASGDPVENAFAVASSGSGRFVRGKELTAEAASSCGVDCPCHDPKLCGPDCVCWHKKTAEVADSPFVIAMTRIPEVAKALRHSFEKIQVAMEQAAATEPTIVEAIVPFSDVPWFENGGRTPPTVAHVIEHGCPAWVANYYAHDVNNLARIHGGYHAQTSGGAFKMLRVSKPLAQVAKPQQHASQSVQPTIQYCNALGCYLTNGQFIPKQKP